MAKRSTEADKTVAPYEHREHERLNNPPVGIADTENDPDATGTRKKTYRYDPHIDPALSWDAQRSRDVVVDLLQAGLQTNSIEDAHEIFRTLLQMNLPNLHWAGKAERTSFEVPIVSLHEHERIDPRTILEAVQRAPVPHQPSLFEEERALSPAKKLAFYEHAKGWTNRLIAGDSLLIMNSLLEKEGMAGKVQMIYFDPPYGIKYSSNFQPFIHKRNVRDGSDEDLTAEPEQIKAFRDTWELGIHSYLTYLRDRLLLARELLAPTGSLFLQINDDNLHLVRCVLDEVFGRDNFVSLITFVKTSGKGSTRLDAVSDYLLWYAKDKPKLKYHPLYLSKEFGKEGAKGYNYIELPNGERRRLSSNEMAAIESLPSGSRIFKTGDLTSQEAGSTTFDYGFQGRLFHPGRNSHWKTGREGLDRLQKAGRLMAVGNTLSYVRFLDEVPTRDLTNIWNDTVIYGDPRIYIVQTNTKVVERCLLMTTDPGDLVLDPTGGSGTTAYVAEKWGRRWIVCDTSRVAIALMRWRLMTALFPYYKLAHPERGVSGGFVYETVPHVTLKSIAHNAEIDRIYERWQPQLEEALRKLNEALRGQPVRYKVRTGGRAGKEIDFAAPADAYHTLPDGERVPAYALLPWEVPYELPQEWGEAARAPFETYHALRRQMQKAMDEAIRRAAHQEVLYDRPLEEPNKVRVTGPFTVEAVPAPVVVAPEAISTAADSSATFPHETIRQHEWLQELRRTGIRARSGEKLTFVRLEPLSGLQALHAEGEVVAQDRHKRIVIAFGPTYAPLSPAQVEIALQEAQKLMPRPELVGFAAFQFDPIAAQSIDEIKWPGVTLLKIQMNADLLTEDLKKRRSSNESFWLIGQPDIALTARPDGQYEVEVRGFDYYDPRRGEVISGGLKAVAMWLLDTDYDGYSLFPRQVFFSPELGMRDWERLAKSLRTPIAPEKLEAYVGQRSLPFAAGTYQRIAVKVIDMRGIESVKVISLQ